MKGISQKTYIADSTPDASLGKIEKQIDNSLKLLGRDYIDFFYLHFPQLNFFNYLKTMNQLREKGKVKHIGVSNFALSQLKEAVKIAPVSFIQSCYNLLWRELDDEFLDFCHDQKIAVTVYSPIAQGLLSGKYKNPEDIKKTKNETVRKNVLFSENIFPHSLKAVKLLGEIAEKYGKTHTQTALKWLLQEKRISSVIIGARSVKQLEDSLGATGWNLEDADWKKLDKEGRKVFQLVNYSGKTIWNSEVYRGIK